MLTRLIFTFGLPNEFTISYTSWYCNSLLPRATCSWVPFHLLNYTPSSKFGHMLYFSCRNNPKLSNRCTTLIAHPAKYKAESDVKKLPRVEWKSLIVLLATSLFLVCMNPLNYLTSLLRFKCVCYIFSRLIRFPGNQNIRLGITLEPSLAGCLANGFIISQLLRGQFEIWKVVQSGPLSSNTIAT